MFFDFWIDDQNVSKPFEGFFEIRFRRRSGSKKIAATAFGDSRTFCDDSGTSWVVLIGP